MDIASLRVIRNLYPHSVTYLISSAVPYRWHFSHPDSNFPGVRVPGVTERNTLFVHMLVWDVRYNEIFLKRLLDAVFISSIHTTHVILVMPPWITPGNMITSVNKNA